MPDLFLVFTLILLGFILLAIELFIIPGFGFVGISGLFCLVIASYVSYTKLNPLTGFAVSIISIVAIVVMIRILPKTKMYKKLRLETTTSKSAGYSATRAGLEELINKEGVTLTPLHPVGTAIVDGKRLDVVCEVGLIDKEKKVVVVKVEGNRVVVKEV